MQTRQLGKTDLQITPLGLGTWAMGGGNWLNAWGEQDDKESVATIHRALELGMNWIDTAAVYGLGHSEEIVGQGLKEWRGQGKAYLFIKWLRGGEDKRERTTDLKGKS